jgi:ubiquinone/menaquinone biosynthesis C-methylase UbiE
MIIEADPSCFKACLGLKKALFQIPPDPHLGHLLESKSGPFRLLDVGCGEGAYLQAQSIAYASRGLEVHGVDISQKMLQTARQNGVPGSLTQGSAESLPYEDGLFDAVACRLSFHLFNKPLALDEMVRVTKPGGFVIIDDLAPGQMPAWWLFHFFPLAEASSHSVFWSPEKIVQSLNKRGLKANYKLEFEDLIAPLYEILETARQRDLPQLLVLREDAYFEGMLRLEQKYKIQPNEVFRSKTAIVRIVGIKNLTS